MTARHRAAVRPATILRYAPVVWLLDAGKRAAWTALAALLPMVAVGTVPVNSWAWVAGVVGGAALASLLTSLVSLPEAIGERVPVWAAIGARVLRTAAQVALPAVVTAVALQDVPWADVGRLVAQAAAVTLIRAVLVLLIPGAALPETKEA